MTDQAIALEQRIVAAPRAATAADEELATSCPIAFGPFLAVPAARILLRHGSPVELGGRAFDLLIVLLRARGEIVSKEHIFRYVWPCITVDESNLRFQMAQLRKALGDGRRLIKTVQGRGYLLMLTDHDGAASPDGAPATPARTSAVYLAEQEIIIREALDRLLRSLELHVRSVA